MSYLFCKYHRGGRNHYGDVRNECIHVDRARLHEGKDKAVLGEIKKPGYIKRVFCAMFGKSKSVPGCILQGWENEKYCPLFENIKTEIGTVAKIGVEKKWKR